MSAASGSAGRRLALDYLSPLPPVRSGISDYSADLLPALAAVCDLRVLRLPDQPVSEAMVAAWNPLPAEAALAESHGTRLPLYQMGNNRHHRAIDDLARRFPGVLTLHDLVLHHLLTEETLGRGEHEPYLQRLAEDHGVLGEVIAVPRRWGGYSDASLFSLPVYLGLLQRQRGVLVHNRWAAREIAAEDERIAVRVVPMGVPLPAAAERSAGLELRRRHGVPDDATVLGSFGFQTPIKRTARVIEALARPGLERVHLLIVGEVSEHSDLEGTAHRAGVAERVHVTGFVPYEDFEAAIAATDLCLNLRYPTAGETSASLLRVLAAGRPAVVSDYAQFAELPGAAVVRVPVGEGEVEALAERLRELLAAPGELRRMGEEARRHVARVHDPALAAAAVVEACQELGRLEPPGPAPAREEVPTTLAWTAVEARLEVSGAEEPWPAGSRRRLRLRLMNRGPARWLAGGSGPGGLAMQAALLEESSSDADRDLLAGRPWIPLPRPVDPGDAWELEVEVRRPPGPCRLRFEPHVLGGPGLGGAAVWQRRLG